MCVHPFLSTSSAAAGDDTGLLWGWKVVQKIALLALSNVADSERGIGS